MPGELSFGEKKHRDFLDKLIDDESLRSAYEVDPVKVLQDHGIGVDPADKPTPGKLPDVETLRASRDQLAKAMDESGGHPKAVDEGFWAD